MYQDQQITCLSCSNVMHGVSVSSLPMNPYLKPQKLISPPIPSHLREDLFYSDSDDEKTRDEASESLKLNLMESHIRNQRVVDKILDGNDAIIQELKVGRKLKNDDLKETLMALESLKLKLEDEVKLNRAQAKINIDLERKNLGARHKFNDVDKMDYQSLKTIYQEAKNIQNELKVEKEFCNVQKLEMAISKSTAKLSFEKADPLLVQLNLDNDQLFLKLLTNFEKDSELLLLTSFMLRKLFGERIITHNEKYKKLADSVYSAPTESFEFLNKSVATNGDLNNFEINLQLSASSASEWNDVKTSKINNNVGKGSLVSAVPPNKPMSFSDMAKKQANPSNVIKRIPAPEKTFARPNRPHCFFKIQVDNETPFRVVFELRPDMAPQMVENFVKLSEGLPDGRGYKGSKIFKAKPDDHVCGGDFDNNDGTGGHSAFSEKLVMAEQCPLSDHKGAIRMRGQERQMDGRCKIGSQFMIWLGDIEYKEYKFTLVFGKVVEGFKQLLEVSRIKGVQKSSESWILKQSVVIVDSGTI